MSPLYDYNCETCKEITSKLTNISDRLEVVNCDKCGGLAKRALSAPNFIVPGGERRVRDSAKDKSSDE